MYGCSRGDHHPFDALIKLFESNQIRTAWDEEKEEWYFSVIDVCGALSSTDNPRRYWSDLKRKLKKEGAAELYEKIVQLKMQSPDGKMRLTDAADTKQLLRIIQSIPSPKAEPFKMWLAEVGNERLNEIADPELAIDRAIETYRRKGYDDAWINRRLKSIEIRHDLTDEWKRSGIEDHRDYAILTDEVSKAWSGMTTREYKNLKGLQKESLRDNMTNMELVLNMLAEVSTTEISKTANPKGLEESKQVAKQGGTVARKARRALEEETGAPVITSKTYRDDLIE